LSENRQLSILFYCHRISKITYGRFLLYCCFNGCNKRRNISDSTPRCAKKLGAMHHCAESKRKMLQKTPCYASLRGVATPRYASLWRVATPRYASLRGVDFNCVQMFDIFINPRHFKKSYLDYSRPNFRNFFFNLWTLPNGS
jgi:hypothetical protein